MKLSRLYRVVALLLLFAGAGNAVAQTAESPRPERAGLDKDRPEYAHSTGVARFDACGVRSDSLA